MIIKTIIAVIAYLILAPFVGGFLAGDWIESFRQECSEE